MLAPKAVNVARYHYDLGNDLFSAMLDDSMSYSCAYWDSVHTLAQAQQQKLRLWCEKLQLAPGMRVIDIGCGWGNFAAYAASQFGVRRTGTSNSVEQCQRKYIFPNGYVPGLMEIAAASSSNFSIEHLQNHGLDYEKTLLAWHENTRSKHCHLHHILLLRRRSA